MENKYNNLKLAELLDKYPFVSAFFSDNKINIEDSMNISFGDYFK